MNTINKIIKIIIISTLLLSCNKVEKKKEVKVSKPQDSVSFIALGDNIIHSCMLSSAKKGSTYDFKPFYKNIKQYVSPYDLSYINQETVLAGKKFKYSGYPEFNTPDEMIDALKDMNINIVNGCNNHTLDNGEEGLNHSIKVFKKNNLKYIGVKEKEIPVVTVNNIKISFLCYTQLSNQHTDTKSISFFDKNKIKKDVTKAKQISDCVIVCAHFGKEYSEKISDFQKEYVNYFNDLGVDVILGSHTHTLQPIKWIKGKKGNKTLVAYGLGNFISGMKEENTQLGAMLSFKITKKDNQTSIQDATVIPVINHYQVKDRKHFDSTRYGFSVYRLKDYTDELASKHAVNGYKGQEIDIAKLKKKTLSKVGDNIDIEY